MRLAIILPTERLVDQVVTKIQVEAENGSFCLLPRHIDFVAALVPGILSFTDVEGREVVVAIDEGVLVKCGDEVSVTTVRATRGPALEALQRLVATEFLALDEHERVARAALARLEARLVRGVIEEQAGV